MLLINQIFLNTFFRKHRKNGSETINEKYLTFLVVTSIVITVSNLLQQEIKQTKPFEGLAEGTFLNLQRTTDFLLRRLCDILKPYEITPPQYNVLRILRGAGEAGLINREIGERMLTFVPDVTRMLDRMEARNLICRERGVADRRLVTAYITVEGLQLLSNLDEVLHKFHENLFAVCNENELNKLIEMLEKLRCNVIEND
jgi:DNA-binding MarR family transcriptional regulator